MRSSYLFIFIQALASFSYCQSSSSDIFKSQGLSLQIIEQRALHLQTGYYSSSDAGMDNRLSIEDFWSTVNLDVLSYNDLDNTYDTELKIKVFKQSDEYRILLGELKQKRSYLMSSVSALKLNLIDFYHSGTASMDDYNLNKQSFKIHLGGKSSFTINNNYDIHRAPKTVYNISTKQLGVKRVSKGKFFGIESFEEIFYIKCNENAALKIENNKENLEMIFLLKPLSVSSVSHFKDWDSNTDEFEKAVYGSKIGTDEVAKTQVLSLSYLRLIIVNRRTNEIYLDYRYDGDVKDLISKDIELARIEKEKKAKEIKEHQQLIADYNNKITKADLAFSQRKYRQSKKIYNQAIEIRKGEYYPITQVEKINGILQFLEERSKMTYNYEDVDYTGYRSIISEVSSVINNRFDEIDSDSEMSLELKIRVDTTGFVSREIIIIDGQDEQLEADVRSLLETIDVPAPLKNGYTLNSIINESYTYSRKSNTIKLKASSGSVQLKSGNAEVLDKHRSLLENDLLDSNYPQGIYEIECVEINRNGEEEVLVVYKDYNGGGGPASAFASMVIPGVGNHLVNNGKGSLFGGNISPWVTTVGVVGLIGGGFYTKTISIKNYEAYHQATEQAEIDKYYELANTQNQRAYTLIGLGGIIWVADIIWTAKKGSNNSKQSHQIKDKLNIAFAPTVGFDNVGFGMTIRLN
jgi:hypothetical protein